MNRPPPYAPVLLFLFLPLVSSPAQTSDDVFRQGNEHYRNGRFADALKAYQAVLDLGYESPELYFNLGNANYRLGKTSGAILAYERASRLKPNDPDILYNLKLVNLKTIDRIEPVPELFVLQWMRVVAGLFSARTTVMLFLLCWVLLFTALSAMYAVRRVTPAESLRWAALAGFAGVLVSGSLLALQAWNQFDARDQSIVTSAVVTAKSSPDDESQDSFVIHEGLKVRTSDSIGDWVKITLPDGKVGWIRSLQCERV